MQQRAEFKHTKYSARHYLATALMFWDIIEWSEKSTFFYKPVFKSYDFKVNVSPLEGYLENKEFFP